MCSIRAFLRVSSRMHSCAHPCIGSVFIRAFVRSPVCACTTPDERPKEAALRCTVTASTKMTAANGAALQPPSPPTPPPTSPSSIRPSAYSYQRGIKEEESSAFFNEGKEWRIRSPWHQTLTLWQTTQILHTCTYLWIILLKKKRMTTDSITNTFSNTI